MNNETILSRIKNETKQIITECISEAVGEDYQEAESHLELKTHVSKPFLMWDLIYRNLMNKFYKTEDILYSSQKRGMWEVLVLYDNVNSCVLSFMRDTRYKAIKRDGKGKTPKYISALLQLNAGLQAEEKQQRFFNTVKNQEKSNNLIDLLNNLCMEFTSNAKQVIKNHILIVFSSNYGRVTSLNAYVLDNDLDIVYADDWFNNIKPAMSNSIEKAVCDVEQESLIKIKPETEKRKSRNNLVTIKDDTNEITINDKS